MLSIIIITKNEEKCLPRLLNSIYNQNYKNYEVIVSDAFSTDKTREIARKFNCKIVDGGLPSKGRNNGARIARGEELLFLDADVIMPKGFLEENLKEFRNRKLDYAGVRLKPFSNKLSDRILHFLYNSWALVFEYIYPYLSGACVFCKKGFFDKVKGFDEKIVFAEDHAFANKNRRNGKFRILISSPILIDVRRLENDGRIMILTKFIIMGLFALFVKNSKKSFFNYKLNGNVNLKI